MGSNLYEVMLIHEVPEVPKVVVGEGGALSMKALSHRNIAEVFDDTLKSFSLAPNGYEAKV